MAFIAKLIIWKKKTNFSSEPSVRHHLVRVYGCLTATTFCAAVGAIAHLLGLFEAGLLSAFGSIGLALYLSFATDDPKTFYTRLATLLGFGFLTGNSIGPLMNLVIAIEPQVVVTALIGTVVVFISLSCSALLAERGSFLFLGGIFMSVLSAMALFGLANIFIQSQLIYQVIWNFWYYILFCCISMQFITISLLGSFIHWFNYYVWICIIWHSNDYGETPSWVNRLYQALNGFILRFNFNVPSFADNSNAKGRFMLINIFIVFINIHMYITGRTRTTPPQE